jgi:hypothetical protein
MQKLRKALEDLRAVREATKIAEERRLATLKAAESATKTAEEKMGAPQSLQRISLLRTGHGYNC